MIDTDTTYTASLSHEGIIVLADRRAGICGPANEGALPADLAAADAWLHGQGFTRSSEWRTVTAYDGLRLTAELVRA